MKQSSGKAATNKDVVAKIKELYLDLFHHEGYGDMHVEIRILRRGQKEVIIHCGKQYRFVVDFVCPSAKFRKEMPQKNSEEGRGEGDSGLIGTASGQIDRGDKLGSH